MFDPKELLQLLRDQAANLAVGGGTTLVLLALYKYAPGLAARYASKEIEQLLQTDDAADKELVLALVKWAEAKLPDAGKGKDRYNMVATKLVSMFPKVLKGQENRLSTMIEEAVARMDAELKRLGGSDGAGGQ